MHEKDIVSATYNKFRIATPNSPNHCWKDGFEERYRSFLQATQDGAVVTVNGICGMSVAEDKGLLGLLFDEEFNELLTPDERRLVDCSVPWTARLEDRMARINGEEVSLLEHLRAHKGNWVIKPANEGRGFGVLIGCDASDEQWQEACQPKSELPCIVQQYTESMVLPIASLEQKEVSVNPMYLTLALALVNGKPSGFVSRVSKNLVTNVAQSGFGQAVFGEV